MTTETFEELVLRVAKEIDAAHNDICTAEGCLLIFARRLIAEVLPEKMQSDPELWDTAFDHGFNACIEEIERRMK